MAQRALEDKPSQCWLCSVILKDLNRITPQDSAANGNMPWADGAQQMMKQGVNPNLTEKKKKKITISLISRILPCATNKGATLKPANALPSVINSQHHQLGLFVCKMIYRRTVPLLLCPHVCVAAYRNPSAEQTMSQATAREQEEMCAERFTGRRSGGEERVNEIYGLSAASRRRHLRAILTHSLLRLITLVFTRARAVPPLCQTSGGRQQRLTESSGWMWQKRSEEK